MTWEETVEELEKIRSTFIALHKRPEKDWEIHEKDAARILRNRCRELGEKRYSLLRVQRKKFETSRAKSIEVLESELYRLRTLNAAGTHSTPERIRQLEKRLEKLQSEEKFRLEANPGRKIN